MAPAAPMQSPAAAPVHRAVATPDDSAVVKLIEKTHFPNGEEIDAMSILHIAKGILDDCKSTPPAEASEEGEGDSATLTPELQFEVYRLSVQLSYRSLEAGDDVQEKTVSLFNMLSSYSWEVKVALILAAYVSSYGEYWLIAHTYRDKDQVAMGMAALLQMSDLLKEDNNKLHTLFQPLHKLLNPILDLCYCIVEVKEFFLSVFASSNTTAGFPGLRATVIICCYWIIRSALICTSYMHSLIVKDPRTTNMDAELDSLARKIQPLRNRLTNQLFTCYKKLDVIDKIDVVGRALKTNDIDNMKVLKLLVDARDDKQTSVFDLFSKKQVSLETLKNKTVLLLISSTENEVLFLQEWYEKCDEVQRRQHAIILFPVEGSDQSSMKSKKFTMPNLYMVDDPGSIDPTVIRFVKENYFQEGPILLAVGPAGRVVHPNALPMIWTWGSKAFPLTLQNEESLRSSETSIMLELLIKDLDDKLLKMVEEGKKSICLYGGDDLEWIERFTGKAKEVANSLPVTLEMFFLGKSTDSVSKLEKIIPDIYSKKLVSESPKLSSAKVRSFWAKLQRILLSRAQYLNKTKQQNTDEEEGVLQELGKLLDKSGLRGWAMFSKGNHIALIGDEDVTMKTLNDFTKWKLSLGFEGALKDHLERLEGDDYSDRPCCHLHFSDELSDEILENIKCPECHRRLGKYTAFLCHNQRPE
ncbi:PREDICTED: protein SIEVE ELEMENT OCCLUSION B-like [Ipomoea nil]|uniref:protein SIEVE ELEMENT OCCLUSION B-like n=1 Tax=Ipomoea nil TaxID=35883 RepID=UPI000900C4D2|nr:PREDICTED: protein SIEVE ELEMENT OCCLUSION B-like [Ipomoea nil]